MPGNASRHAIFQKGHTPGRLESVFTVSLLTPRRHPMARVSLVLTHDYRHYQHGPASAIGEPYVYTYDSRDYKQLEDAIHRALVTPIGR